MFSNKQTKILEFGFTNYDAIIADGAIRSGKTSAMIIGYILWAMHNFNNQNFIISSVTIQTCERNIIRPLQSIKYLQDNFKIHYNMSSSQMFISRNGKMNIFYVFGGKDERSFTTVQGLTAAGALLDEVPLMPQSFVNQVLARCSVPKSKIWFNCNPENPTHWFFKEWIQKADSKNVLYLHFTMQDNPSLAEEIKKRYEVMYTGVFFDRYIKGLWTKAEGIIYRKFADNPSKYILKEIPQDIIMCNMGVDFGGNKSAHTFVLTGYTAYLKKVIVLEAERHNKELSPNELDELFVKFCRKCWNKYKKPFNVRADNAEPVLMRGLKNACIINNLHANVWGAQKKEISQRINLVIRLIGLDRFYVMDHCTTVIDSLSNCVWDDKNPDRRLDNGSVDIDTMDAMEYSIEEFENKLIDNWEGITND